MAVMARETWTDERLDDLNKRVGGLDRRIEAGFAEVGEEFRALRTETKGEFQAVRTEMKEEFRTLRSDLNHLTYGLIGTMLIGFLGTIAALVTQA